MKKNITYVDAAHFEKVLVARGLALLPQAGFIKVSGAKGRNLYIAKTKRVGRIDLSGFEVPVEMGVTNLGGEAFGAVKQQMDFTLAEADILANFEKVLNHMLALPERVIEKKTTTPKPASLPKAQGWSVAPVASLDGDAAAKRKALIAKVAAEKGVSVSKGA
jgi:hypothetical protein